MRSTQILACIDSNNKVNYVIVVTATGGMDESTSPLSRGITCRACASGEFGANSPQLTPPKAVLQYLCKVSYAVAHENAHMGAALMYSLHLDWHRHESFVLTPSLGRRDLTSDTTSLPFTAVDFV